MKIGILKKITIISFVILATNIIIGYAVYENNLILFILMMLFTILFLIGTGYNLFQIKEKEKRAAELSVANKELAFQNNEKEKRATELTIANQELVFQNKEKENRAAELIVANKELAFQNDEKEKRAAELIIANHELVFQNNEKEKRAAELIVANNELAFQNDEKEKRAAELIIINKELQSFSYVASHDLQEPLRKIQTLAKRILEKENENLSDNGKDYFNRMLNASKRMQTLIEDLLAFSRVTTGEREFKNVNLHEIVEEIKNELKETLEEKQGIIEAVELCEVNIIHFQFNQLLYNLFSNALKFSKPEHPPHIIIKSRIIKGNKLIMENPILPIGRAGGLSIEEEYCHITISDNGIGFEPKFNMRIFEVFQRLHGKGDYAGTGIGLAIVKKIVENHNGIVIASGELNKGATFDIYIPQTQSN